MVSTYKVDFRVCDKVVGALLINLIKKTVNTKDIRPRARPLCTHEFTPVLFLDCVTPPPNNCLFTKLKHRVSSVNKHVA